jgi:peptidoglycan/LPS O-acetylase OafA/YrhL
LAAHGGVALVLVVTAMLIVEASGFFGSFEAQASRTATFWDMPVRIAGAAAVVLILVMGQAPRVNRLLSLPKWCWIGTISYGIYLWHDGIIREFDRVRAWESSMVLPAGFAVGVTLVVASTSWYVVERPLLDRVRRAQRRASISGSPARIAPPSGR